MRHLFHIITLLTACEASHSVQSYNQWVGELLVDPRDRQVSKNSEEIRGLDAPESSPTSESRRLALAEPQLPRRAMWSQSGSKFTKETAFLGMDEREQAIYREIASGNFPEFLRQLVPITLKGEILDQTGSRRSITAVIRVMPDYLAVGSNDDFVRVPMNYYTATKLAQDFNLVLPTDKIVDAINQQAAVRASPIPLPAGPAMGSNAYFAKHQLLIQNQLGIYPLGALVSGIKKDVVLAEKLSLHQSRIAIYGWHQLNGRPIQPLSDIHHADYADYSHGVRLISPIVEIEGVSTRIEDLLADWRIAPLFTSEGRIRNVAKLMKRSRQWSVANNSGLTPYLRGHAINLQVPQHSY